MSEKSSCHNIVLIYFLLRYFNDNNIATDIKLFLVFIPYGGIITNTYYIKSQVTTNRINNLPWINTFFITITIKRKMTGT